MEVQNQNNADQNENLIKKIKEIDPDKIIQKENLKNYEGSLNEEKKKNSENKTNDKVLFKQFIGIGPKRFLDLFSLTLSCKEIDGC